MFHFMFFLLHNHKRVHLYIIALCEHLKCSGHIIFFKGFSFSECCRKNVRSVLQVSNTKCKVLPDYITYYFCLCCLN